MANATDFITGRIIYGIFYRFFFTLTSLCIFYIYVYTLRVLYLYIYILEEGNAGCICARVYDK